MKYACIDAAGLVLWTTDLPETLDPAALFQPGEGQRIIPAPDEVQGKRWQGGAWIDLPPAPAPDPLIETRATRDRLLTASDWTQLPDAPLTDAQRAAWAAYRQALRDLPATGDWLQPPKD